MNKQLIKKYKAEFDYWLDGGKLQVKFVNDPWEEAPKDIFSYSTVNFILVIDDEYVEFRKALAEGKKIEVLDVDGKWKDTGMTSSSRAFIYPLEEYRIKPEEPKFKVGDWVVHNGVIKRVTMTVNGLINGLDKQLVVIKKEESLELWKPKSNEYFWYKNDLVKFDKTETNAGVLLQSIRGCSYYPSEDFKDFCEPFIGQLPTILKETK